jgi:hypothetical protein
VKKRVRCPCRQEERPFPRESQGRLFPCKRRPRILGGFANFWESKKNATCRPKLADFTPEALEPNRLEPIYTRGLLKGLRGIGIAAHLLPSARSAMAFLQSLQRGRRPGQSPSRYVRTETLPDHPNGGTRVDQTKNFWLDLFYWETWDKFQVPEAGGKRGSLPVCRCPRSCGTTIPGQIADRLFAIWT